MILLVIDIHDGVAYFSRSNAVVRRELYKEVWNGHDRIGMTIVRYIDTVQV